jgi:hypothetical protein
MNTEPQPLHTEAGTENTSEPIGETGIQPLEAQPSTAPEAEAEPRLPLWVWVVQGLRAAALLQPRTGLSAPAPWQLLVLLVLASALQTGLARLEVDGPAQFSLAGWLYPWCITSFLVFVVWAACIMGRRESDPPQPVAAWLGLWTVANLPLSLLGILLSALAVHEQLPGWWYSGAWYAWALYGLMWVWLIAIVVRVTLAVVGSGMARASLVAGLVLLQAFATWQVNDSRPWQADYTTQAQDEAATLKLSQSVFEKQQVLLDQGLEALRPGTPGRVNVFGLVFAPYAQDVFLRESGMVAGVLQDRFDAKGRVLQLVNHPRATETIPWATTQNLEDAIGAMAKVMDRERDVMVLYLTSHGGSDFRLAASHWPLEVDELTPQMLRKMLDNAGIRNRVIAVSACYSGGWIEPLASDTTLAMTAADATHTSYGCGRKSELTFFGRAMFDEQLRKTHSFEQAFQNAVPVIAQREVEGKKTDGFSNPQISVGAGIRPVLLQLAKALDAAR